MEWLPIMGAVTGCLAIAGTLYGFGFKFSRLETRVNLIWSVFVEDALRNQVRSGFLTHSSPYKRTESGESFGDLVSPAIFSKLTKKNFKSDHALTTALIKEVGLTNIINESDKLDITLQEYLALCVCTLKTPELDDKTKGKVR